MTPTTASPATRVRCRDSAIRRSAAGINGSTAVPVRRDCTGRPSPVCCNATPSRPRAWFTASTSRRECLGRGAGCSNWARPDLWEPRVSNHPRPPGATQNRRSSGRTATRHSWTWGVSAVHATADPGRQSAGVRKWPASDHRLDAPSHESANGRSATPCRQWLRLGERQQCGSERNLTLRVRDPRVGQSQPVRGGSRSAAMAEAAAGRQTERESTLPVDSWRLPFSPISPVPPA